MKFSSQAQRKAVMARLSSVSPRRFFIARFDILPEHDKGYYNEWEKRFNTGHPQSYMDSISLKVYKNLQKDKDVVAVQTKTGKYKVVTPKAGMNGRTYLY
jgi:hypothetical protein